MPRLVIYYAEGVMTYIMDDLDRKKITFHISHDTTPVISTTHHSTNVSKRFTKKDWIKIILSAASAVISGIILGVIILSFFNGSFVDTEDIHKTSETTVLGASSIQTFDVQETTFYVLQLGVFRSEQNVMRAQRQYEKEYSSAIPFFSKEANQLFQLYAGISLSKSAAEGLRDKYSQIDSIPYVKPIVLPKLQIKTDKQALATQAKFRIESRRLAELLLTATDHQAIRESHKQWSTFVQNLRQHSETIASERTIRLINQAFLAWGEYQKHPHAQHKLVIQRNIMEVILTKDAI